MLSTLDLVELEVLRITSAPPASAMPTQTCAKWSYGPFRNAYLVGLG
jgi:hypothetical protein